MTSGSRVARDTWVRDGVCHGIRYFNTRFVPGAYIPVARTLGAGQTSHEPYPPEEPVATVLAVRLSNVKQLNVGGVTLHVIAEQGSVVVHVPIIESQAHLLHGRTQAQAHDSIRNYHIRHDVRACRKMGGQVQIVSSR